jgi:hypothetical protein
VQALRRGDAAGEVHEPVIVLLPEMSTAAEGFAHLAVPLPRACVFAHDTPRKSGILRTLAHSVAEVVVAPRLDA